MTILKVIGRSFCVIGMALLAICLIVNIPNQVIHIATSQGFHRGSTTAEIAVIGTILSAAGLAILRKAHNLNFLSPRDALPIPEPSDDFDLGFFETELNNLFSDVSQFELAGLIESTLTSWTLNLRTTEHVEPTDTRLLRTVERLTTPPPSARAGDRWFVPVLRHRKGRLIDELTIKIDDKLTHTLPYKTNTALSLLIIHELFCDALGKSYAQSTRLERGHLRRVQELIAHPRQRSTTTLGLEARSALLNLWNLPENAQPSQFTPQQLRLIRTLNYLSDFYVLFAEHRVGPDSDPKVRVVAQYDESRRHLYRGLSNRTRRFMGVPVTRHRISINDALDSVSYHFRCQASEGMYLYALTPRHRFLGSLRRSADATIELKVSPTFGTPAAHFYSRRVAELFDHSLHDEAVDEAERQNVDSPEYRLRGLYLDIEYRPVPPGLSAPIFILSLYLSIITTALAVAQERIFSANAAQHNNAVLSLVVALPALMSGWVASRFDREGLRQATPNMIFELLSLLTISVLTVGVTAFKVSSSREHESASIRWFLNFDHPTWSAVWFLAVTHTLVSGASLITRLARHERALLRAEKLRKAQLTP